MEDARAGGEPLHVALAVARGGAEGVGVIEEPRAHDGDRLESTVGMAREAGDGVPVVHVPAGWVAEVATDVVARERRRRPHLGVSPRVVVEVVGAEEKGVGRLPDALERLDPRDGLGARGLGRLRRGRRGPTRAPILVGARAATDERDRARGGEELERATTGELLHAEIMRR